MRVNHPSHYNLPGKKECIEEMLDTYGEKVTAIFCLTNAYKYWYRAGHKDGSSMTEDTCKALWYLNFVEKRLHSIIHNDDVNKLYEDVKRLLEDSL